MHTAESKSEKKPKDAERNIQRETQKTRIRGKIHQNRLNLFEGIG